MKRAIGFSLAAHLAVFLVFGFWLCPWLESRYTSDRRAFVDVELFEIGAKTQFAGKKSEKPSHSTRLVKPPVKEASSTESFIPQAVAAPTPAAPAVAPNEAPIDPKTEMVELEDRGDGVSSTQLTVLDYFRFAIDKNEPPVYPRLARLKQEQGVVLIRVVVRREGNLAESVELARSSGSELLDRVALETVGRWSFPAYKSARLKIEGVIPFKFSLEE